MSFTEKINFVIKKIKNHSSIILIFIGALSLFFSNIVAKKIFSNIEYNYYAIILTYFSIVYLLGLLGLEQTFLRFTLKKEKNVFQTPDRIILYIFLISLLTSLIGSLLLVNYYNQLKLNFLFVYFTTFSLVSSLFVYNVFRLNEDFILSQSIANFWKFFLLIISFFSYFIYQIKITIFFYCLGFLIILIFILSFFYLSKKIKFNFYKLKENYYLLSFNFFISILTFTCITFIDRILVESKFSFNLFGNYFYLANLFLAPFSILQNYLSFKLLVIFKKDFNLKYYKKINYIVLLFGFIFGFFLFFLIYLFCKLGFIEIKFSKDFSIIVLLILFGIVRLHSSIVISLFESNVDLDTLKKSNLIILFSIILLSFVAYYICLTLESILFVVLFMWILKTFIQNTLIMYQIKE